MCKRFFMLIRENYIDRSYASFKGGDMHGFVEELYHIYLQEHTIGHKEQPRD